MNSRIKLLKISFVVVLALVAIRLFYWQIIRFEDLTVRAEDQHLTTIKTQAQRGNIISSDGYPLAINKPTFLLYGLPKVIADKEGVALRLAQVLYPKVKSQLSPTPGIDDLQAFDAYKQKLVDDLSQNLYWVILAKDLDINTKNEIDKLGISGIGFDSGLSRYYPESSSAAHLLGFVGSDALGDPKGYFGLEGYYNRELQGVNGQETLEKDAFGMPILIGKFFQKPVEEGDTLVLNINRTIQHIVENELKKGMIKYGAISSLAVVMDPKSGAILAMAAYPNYDPNDFWDFPKDSYINPVVADSYEPGSTFKVVVMSAALDTNVITPQTPCDNCAGPVKMDGYEIRTWNNQYFPHTTTTETLIHSDNTGMVFVGKKLGLDNFYKYITKFGFGQSSGIDLQDELSPSLRPESQWSNIDLATATFGQGIAVTPIQMIKAVSAIANGGKLMEPHVVKEIIRGGKTIEIKPKVITQVISSKAASETTQMMIAAVEQGEAKFYALKGYKIAGKTGTAQIPLSGHYDPTKTNASFIGFAPANDPKFAILILYEQPSSSIWGAETAAPTFFNIAKQLFAYYGIAPK